MTHEQLEQVVLGLSNLVMAQTAADSAQRVAFDSLLAVVGTAFPPLLEPMAEKLQTLQSIVRADVDEDHLHVFDNTIANIQARIEVLRS